MLICNVDEIEDEEDEMGSASQPTDSESASTGSDSGSSGNGLRIRSSMKKMRERLERKEIGITKSEQGESLSARLGDTCRFLLISTAECANPMEYLMEMVAKASEKRKNETNRCFFPENEEICLINEEN